MRFQEARGSDGSTGLFAFGPAVGALPSSAQEECFLLFSVRYTQKQGNPAHFKSFDDPGPFCGEVVDLIELTIRENPPTPLIFVGILLNPLS